MLWPDTINDKSLVENCSDRDEMVGVTLWMCMLLLTRHAWAKDQRRMYATLSEIPRRRYNVKYLHIEEMWARLV